MKPVIVCVDRERAALQTLVDSLNQACGPSYGVVGHADSAAALAHIKALARDKTPLAMCLSPLDDPIFGGGQLLDRVARIHPTATRVILTGRDGIQAAINAMRRDGFDHYLVKPWRVEDWRPRLAALLGVYKNRARLSRDVAPQVGEHLFITGATGFIGERLVRELLRCTRTKLTLLTRSRANRRFDERLSLRPQDFPGRLRCLEGSVTEPDLGLPPSEITELERSVDEVWHLAAVTAFDDAQRASIFRTNLFGTANLVAFAARLRKLQCFCHFSTAYVAGLRAHPDVVTEDIAFPPEGFKNPYEESKCYAEHVVASSGLPYIIYRPSIVIGESFSGRSDDKTIYGVAKVYHVAKLLAERRAQKRGEPLNRSFRVIGLSEALKNLIPVDCVIDMMLRTRRTPQAIGNVFHLTHTTPTTVGEIAEAIVEVLGIEGHELTPEAVHGQRSYQEEIVHKELASYERYGTISDPVFDMTNTQSLAGVNGLPEIDKAFLQFCIRSFFAYHGTPTVSAANRLESQETPHSLSA